MVGKSVWRSTGVETVEKRVAMPSGRIQGLQAKFKGKGGEYNVWRRGDKGVVKRLIR